MTTFRTADRPLDRTELQPMAAQSHWATCHEYALTAMVVFVAAIVCTLVAL